MTCLFCSGVQNQEALISLYVLLKTPLTGKQIKETGIYKAVKECATQEGHVNIRDHAERVIKVWEGKHLLEYVKET